MFVLNDLPEWHIELLEWFESNAGKTFAQRPFDVGLTKKVTSAQKGIWKPAGSVYAVSVVQTPKGVYDDQDPIAGERGWEYYYHQEGQSAEDLKDPLKFYSNVGLFHCMTDGIPVGVVIPSRTGRGYEVLGLALVAGHSDGFFRLEGPVSVGAMSGVPSGEVSVSLIDFALNEFDPQADIDSRLKVYAQVSRRQGAPRFRKALLQAYEGRCAMSQFDAEGALEAAHILPYRGPQTNHITNGLLLRADLHDLFDLGLLAVDADSMRLRISPELIGTRYDEMDDTRLWLPREKAVRPNEEALARHFEQSRVA